jgi:GNAT superfamily N-acetyltransferase
VAYAAPRPLERRDALDQFDCGVRSLDQWLREHAVAAHASGSARVFVTTHKSSGAVVGYYALAAGGVEPRHATARLAKGQPRHRAIPVVVPARLAVDRGHQGAGLGRSLLRDALIRVLGAAEEIGLRAVVVHAQNEDVRGWYESHGFERSPTDPLHLVRLMKDIRKSALSPP